MGSAENDYLNGGDNNDVLKGGTGSDIFKLSKGNDTIINFKNYEGDKVAIPEEFINDFTIAPNGSDSLVSVEGYGDILLSGINPSLIEELNATIFVRLSWICF